MAVTREVRHDTKYVTAEYIENKYSGKTTAIYSQRRCLVCKKLCYGRYCRKCYTTRNNHWAGNYQNTIPLN